MFRLYSTTLKDRTYAEFKQLQEDLKADACKGKDNMEQYKMHIWCKKYHYKDVFTEHFSGTLL